MKVKPLDYIIKQKFFVSFLEKMNNQWEKLSNIVF